jgi:hypothetical protein
LTSLAVVVPHANGVDHQLINCASIIAIMEPARVLLNTTAFRRIHGVKFKRVDNSRPQRAA